MPSNVLDDIYGISLKAIKYEIYDTIDVSIKILSKFDDDQYKRKISPKIIKTYLNDLIEQTQFKRSLPKVYEINEDLNDSEMPIYG